MENNESNDSIASKDKHDCDSPVRIKDEPPDDIKVSLNACFKSTVFFYSPFEVSLYIYIPLYFGYLMLYNGVWCYSYSVKWYHD